MGMKTKPHRKSIAETFVEFGKARDKFVFDFCNSLGIIKFMDWLSERLEKKDN